MENGLFSKVVDQPDIMRWNETSKEYPLDKCLHQLIEEQVDEKPDNPAICFEGLTVSFSELNRRSNQCAHYLRSLGIGPDSIVGVLMERSVELITALLGILKAGGAYLPLDPGYPDERLGFMLEDAGVTVILSQERFQGAAAGFEGTRFNMDSQWEFIEDELDTNPERNTTPDNLAYIIYTSGSTGKPKGCMLPHRAICNRLLWMQDKYGLTVSDRVLQKTPFTFDVSVWEFFWPLVSGACLVVAKPGGHKDNNYLIDLINREKVTTCHFVPSMLRYFVSNPNVQSCSSLKRVFASGEALTYELMTEFQSKLSAKLHNLYGPTEAAVDVTYWECTDRQDKKVPIGKPISNIKMYILDPELKQVAIGEEGELHIGGIGLARGYLNRHELTAEKFIKDPFSKDENARLYKTGDKASYLSDGNIEYLGRIDFQVKLRGNRIELGEIEAVLREHESIEEAAVLVRDEASGDPKLVAYITVKGELPETKQIRAYIKSKLPDYMVPNVVVPMESMPVTQHGKLDRDALPWTTWEHSQEIEKKIEYKKEIALNESIETMLKEYIEKVLDISGVSKEDDLFDLGATSLTMVQLVENIQKQYGVSIPVELFLEEPSIKAIVNYICSELEGKEISSCAELPKQPDMEHSAAEKDKTDIIVGDLLEYFNGVLEMEGLKADDDLFDMGATSLTMVRIVERIQKKYNLSIPVEVFLEEPTISSIGKYIVANLDEGTELNYRDDFRDITGAEKIINLQATDFREEAYKKAEFIRSFSGKKIPFDDFCHFLSLLKEEKINGNPKYLYPSAGGLNAVQTYVYIKDDAVEGIKKGVYYYHPQKHSLYLLSDKSVIDRDNFFEIDRPLFDRAGFALFFIAQLNAILPEYHGISPRLVTLDTGYMEQLLLIRQLDFNLSVCPVEGIDFNNISEFFKLDEGHRFIHCILGGIPNEQPVPVGAVGAGNEMLDYLVKTGKDINGHLKNYDGDCTFAKFLEFNYAASIKGMSFLNKQEHDDFLAQQLNLRRFDKNSVTVALEPYHFRENSYEVRSCQRDYIKSPVPFENISRFLTLLRQTSIGERSCYLYPTVSGMHSIQAYLYIKENGVEGLDEGIYYYHPEKHALVLITSKLSKKIKPSYTPFNRKHYQDSGFCLYLVGQMKEMKKVYKDDWLYFALLDAGYMGQLLMDKQAEFHMGICPIGGLDFDRIRQDFKLEEGQELLHSYTCGGFNQEVDTAHEFLEKGRAVSEKIAEPLQIISINETRKARIQDIAIIGISGRYPGADNMDIFWENLAEGKSSITEIAEERKKLWKMDQAENAIFKGDSIRGGYLDGIECFDSLLFNISPSEACSMDPQERIFMESVWECLENAGYTAKNLSKNCRKVGVFAGAMWSDYQNQSSNLQSNLPGVQASSLQSSIANRVSYFFNFNGPSIALNTSCSSAATAVHLACESIKRGECDAAIVGGVNILSHQYHQILLKQLDLLSKDGECRPLGAMSSGWLPGEGVGTLLIRPLEEAERDKDYIHGIIKGTAIGHSGKTSRFGAPSAKMQAESIREAVDNANVALETIGYIEVAAAGAAIADASEIDAIMKVFKREDGTQIPCLAGSLKANIGHLESASAMSQIMKVLLQMKNGQIAPTISFKPISPMVRLQDSRLEVVDELRGWSSLVNESGRAEKPVRALINAFGATGSGGHIILEGYKKPEKNQNQAEGSVIILLSAASQEQLSELVSRLLSKLSSARNINLKNLGYSLRVGRVEMQERLAVVAENYERLIQKLKAFLEKEQIEGLYLGTADAEKGILTKADENDLDFAGSQWVKGVQIDWSGLDDGREERIPLPTYPFDRERHWIKSVEEDGYKKDDIGIQNNIFYEDIKTFANVMPETNESEILIKKTEEYLKGLLAGVTQIPVSKIKIKTPLEMYGVGSLMIKSLNTQLEKDFGELPKTLFYEYQTLQDLAKYFVKSNSEQLKELLGYTKEVSVLTDNISGKTISQKNQSSVVLQDCADTENRNTEIAIIGVAGRYPKANNLKEFWDNLKNGVDCITEIPKTRWDYDKYFDPRKNIKGKAYSKWGGFIDDVDKFDPLFFNISPREAVKIDPQERLFLETVWHTFEDAGYNRQSINKTFHGNMGVFVGVMYGEYQMLNALNEKLSIISSYSSVANRVSYMFDFHGPSMAVDTMCSSSLTAIHLAVESIRRGECEAAIAGGVNLSLHPNKYIAHSQMAMSSSDGRCRSFGQGGDGFVAGEGVGALLLKPLNKALEDGDRIYGVIKSSSVNHGGKTNGYTVPNPVAQGNLILDALKKATIDPGTISYIETHGTGTSLGDPIEIAGLTRSLGEYVKEKHHCPIGSVKSNIGHLEGAAGIAGITKVLLQMKYGYLVPSLHSVKTNSNIDFENSPFYVQQDLSKWERPVVEEDKNMVCPRRASISSFGAGGANAHIIMEEYIEPQEIKEKKEQGLYAIVLSAKNKERLKEYAQNLLDAIQKKDFNEEDLPDISYTLQVGREAMEERLAFVTVSLTEFEEKLNGFLSDKQYLQGIYQGSIKENREVVTVFDEDEELMEAVEKWIQRRKYSKLLEFWVKGLEIDWSSLYKDNRPKRVCLPQYPFARERYWISEEQAKSARTSIVTSLRVKQMPENRRTGYQVISGSKQEESSKTRIFEEVWQEQELLQAPISKAKNILVFLSEQQNQQSALMKIQALNPDSTIIFISEGTEYRRQSKCSYSLDSKDVKTYERAFKDILSDYKEVDALFYLWALETSNYMKETYSIVYIIQALAAAKLGAKRLILAGQCSEGVDGCYLDSWIGFERSLKLLMPNTSVTVASRETKEQNREADIDYWIPKLWAELNSEKAVSALFKEEKRYVSRILPASITIGSVPIKKGGTYVITGGCGGLGFILAEHFVKTNQANLVLTGRKPIDEEKELKIKKLEALGGRAIYLQADVCDTKKMMEGLRKAKDYFGEINGVVHAAGVQDNDSILKKDIFSFQKVLEPKIDGTIALEEVLKGEALDFVCYFSSSSAILGDFGSCDYAVGNRFQTSYARYRNGQEHSEKTVVINWPLWKDGGMNHGNEDRIKMYLKSSGLNSLETPKGLKLFDSLLAQDNTQYLVITGQESGIKQALEIFEEETFSAYDTVLSNKENVNQYEFKSANTGELIENDLKDIISKVLRIPPDNLDCDVNFADFGFDSISLGEFATLLNAHYGIEITPALFYGYSTIEKLSQYLLQENQELFHRFYAKVEEPSRDKQTEALLFNKADNLKHPRFRLKAMNVQQTDPEPIAIIGISGRFPGADTVEELWTNLRNSRECITEIPENRWDWSKYYGGPDKKDGKTNSKWGGFISGIDKFDPLFFEISPKEAEAMDPQQRLFLQEAWHALEDAGYMGKKIKGMSCGVYVGVEESQYNSLYGKNAPINSNRNATLPGRIAYELDLKGPAMAINTACSSGLVAIHQACQALRQGECEMSLAGGVSLTISPDVYVGFSKNNMLSPDGKSYVFDERANGLVPSEAVAVIVLKPFSKAVKDNDRIYGCIKASGVNYNGRSNGITAPNLLSQTELLKSIYDKYHINPGNIQYILAHSVGSKVGDQIEVQALLDAFGKNTGNKGYCRLGSLKPMIGHTFAASGVVSLISMLLAMKYKTIPGTHNFEYGNEYINLVDSPFVISKENQTWETNNGCPRAGAISATGISGTNAHVVIEEYIPEIKEGEPADSSPQILLFSAKNSERLSEVVKQMREYINSELSADVKLADIAYTLRTGREAMRERMAVIVSSKEELSQKLEEFLSLPMEKLHENKTFTGKAESFDQAEERTRVQNAMKERNLEQLALLWVERNEVLWEDLFAEQTNKKVSLPTYPFKKRSCWVGNKHTQEGAGSQLITQDCENKAAELYTYNALNRAKDFKEEYLTFCPFDEKIPGFSMSRVFLNPEKYPEEVELIKTKQIEMRNVLFYKEDFSNVQTLFDIGCGHGTDLIQFARLYSGIRVQGFTITPAQAELGNQRITQMNLDNRAKIFYKDSSKDVFPDKYDIIIGIEVCCHIHNKQGLFGNIYSALKEGGKVLLMDFIANLRGSIEDPNVEISIATENEWLKVMASHHLAIEDIIDVSPQIANFLYDPNHRQNIESMPKVVQDAVQNFANSSISLQKGWLSYCLFKLRKDSSMSEIELMVQNHKKILNKTPYMEAVKEMEHDSYLPYTQQ